MLFFRNPSPELISIHIPKTAGTSFRNILKNVYGDAQVVRFDISEKGKIKLNEIVYEKSTLPKVRVIHGHFTYTDINKYFTLPENYKLITWMRDPVKRVISNFFYLESILKLKLNDEKENVRNLLDKMQRTLIEYSRVDMNRNRQTKFLTGISPENFDFIGIQELFDQEIGRLSNVLNWKSMPEILHQNITPETRPLISDEIIHEIRELNQEDERLYKEAIRIRERKLQS